jgi:hypothetical protein
MQTLTQTTKVTDYVFEGGYLEIIFIKKKMLTDNHFLKYLLTRYLKYNITAIKTMPRINRFEYRLWFVTLPLAPIISH